MCPTKFLLGTSNTIPDSKVHGANMGPTCVLLTPDGPHVGPMNLGIRDSTTEKIFYQFSSTTTKKCITEATFTANPPNCLVYHCMILLVRYILLSVSLRLSQFSYNIWGCVACVYSAYPFLLWWLWDYLYFIVLTSSNRMYDPYSIV